MSEIAVNGLSFGYEGSYENVFEDVSFHIDTDWKLGFIGRNGKGKTTFLRLLQGLHEYQGSITKSVEVDYFPFVVKNKEKNTVDVLEEVYPAYEFWEVCREWNYLDGSEDVWYRPFSTLSNGEQTKVLLALLFTKKNHFLLIDEPTNHLDQEARETVKRYLNRKKGFLLVSHDRDFLDGCIDHVLVLNRNNIEVMQGNFTTWWENKKKQDAFELAENEKLKKEIGRLKSAAEQAYRWADEVESTKIGPKSEKYEKCIDTRAYVGEKSRRMQMRRKNLEHRKEREIEDKEKLLKNIEKEEALKLHFLRHNKEILIQAEHLTCKYGERTVCGEVDFTLRQGDCLVLEGKNGSGKSSVIKKILGEAVEGDGILTVVQGLKVSYVLQNTENLYGKMDEYAVKRGIDKTLFYQFLRKFDFKRENLGVRLEALSEGQKKKVLLAASLCEQAHLYIWDEPLNYIDIYTRMQLEELIIKYRPTMLLVEHDRAFVRKVGTSYVKLEAI